MSFYFFTAAVFVAIGTLLTPVIYFPTLIVTAVAALIVRRSSVVSKHVSWPVIITVLVALSFGFIWLQWQLQHRLPITLDKHKTELELFVLESKMQPPMQRLLVRVESSPSELKALGLPPLRYLQLNFYKSNPVIQPQTVIKTELVLRSPRNIANGLAFDYEAWLMSKSIDASGYVLHLEVVSKKPSSLRSNIIKQQQGQHAAPVWPWIAGLVLGEQDSFTADQWQLAKRTGTLHLLVVSGLHMGLVLVLLVGVWRLLLRLSSLSLGKSLPYLMQWQLGFLLLGSVGYLWLAGSGVALQRAWLMFAVVLLIQSTRLKFSWLTTISFALLLVVVINPLVWTGPGFSYSFAAVSALLLFFTARRSSVLEAMWLPQWVIFVALFPLFIWWQQPVSFVQCITNLLAIPFVSFILLPLSLLNLAFPNTLLAAALEQAGEWFWTLLFELSLIPLSSLTYMPSLSLLLWPLFLVLIRRGVSIFLAIAVCVLIISAMFMYKPAQVAVAKMIDVGQGQSLVFTTKQHALVYDAGPFMGQFDTGDAVITPVLYKLGVKQIDALIISHNDNDHAGGTRALLNNFVVAQWWGGQPVKELPKSIYLCSQAPKRWHVLSNNILYRYLNVDENAFTRIPDNNNNRSCVVQLEWYGTRFLLTGDISKAIEYDLIRKYGAELSSDILVLGHHGSDTSTSVAFLNAVEPKEAWISAGFNNKFNHPNWNVLQRLEEQNIPWRNTAEKGAISLHPNGRVITERETWQPPWRQLK